MEYSHPIEKDGEFKEMISGLEINYTKHFEQDRLPYRENITSELIRRHLKNPNDLVEFTYSEDRHEREKYEALFDKSSKYFLKIVLSVEADKLFIVTAHIINKTHRDKSKMIGQ